MNETLLNLDKKNEKEKSDRLQKTPFFFFF